MAFRLRPPRYLVPMIVACALFMENMDATVIATALPTIARDFGESAASIACYGFFRSSTPHSLMIGVLLVGGFFRSLQFTSLNTMAYAQIDPLLMSRATPLSAVGQQLSLSFGVGLGALLLHATLLYHGRGELGATDFSPAYFAIAGISLLSLFFFAPLPRDAGAEISGRRETRPEAIAEGAATHPAE